MSGKLTAVAARVRASWDGLVGQALRFGLIGAAATVTHTGIFWLAFTQVGLHHVLANVAAFLVAFEVSYRGHAGWSFARASQRHDGRRWRLFFVALGGLALNVAWGWVAFGALGAGFGVFAALQIGVTPMVVFLLSRTWVFRAS